MINFKLWTQKVLVVAPAAVMTILVLLETNARGFRTRMLTQGARCFSNITITNGAAWSIEF